MISALSISAHPSAHSQIPARFYHALLLVGACTLVATCLGGVAGAQAITIDTHSGANRGNGTVDRRFSQIQPTNVPLEKSELDAKTRLELIRVMQAEQGFAMRPFPMGHKGLTLEANGKLDARRRALSRHGHAIRTLRQARRSSRTD